MTTAQIYAAKAQGILASGSDYDANALRAQSIHEARHLVIDWYKSEQP